MTISETIAYLQQFSKSGKPVKDLSRMQSLLDELGNPQEQLRFVHIAGTNGKGSVVAYGSAAAIAAGIKTGQFTSPFVRHYQDRIQVNGIDISDDRLCALCEQVTACHVSKACSQFEVTLAIALLYFVEQKCELVFLETGLGGLLDATNVIKDPLVSVITSISFDHMAILGNTLPEIATQKAGIIKEHCPVVVSPDNPESVRSIMQETAAEKHTTVTIPEMQACTILQRSLTETKFSYQNQVYTLHMPGKHQIANALTAIETLHILQQSGFPIPETAIPHINRFFLETFFMINGVTNRNAICAIDRQFEIMAYFPAFPTLYWAKNTADPKKQDIIKYIAKIAITRSTQYLFTNNPLSPLMKET